MMRGVMAYPGGGEREQPLGSSVRPAPSRAAADWIVAASRDSVPATFFTWGPNVYDAWARVSIARGSDAEPVSGLDDAALYRTTYDVLSAYTRRPSECFVLAWQGSYGRTGITLPDAPVVTLFGQAMLLFQADLDDVPYVVEVAWGEVPPSGYMPPQFVWPADRAWMVVQDIDEESSFCVGGSRAAVAGLRTRLGEVARAASHPDA